MIIIIITTGYNSTTVLLIQIKCHTTADYTAVLKAEYRCGKCTENRWSFPWFDIDLEYTALFWVELQVFSENLLSYPIKRRLVIQQQCSGLSLAALPLTTPPVSQETDFNGDNTFTSVKMEIAAVEKMSQKTLLITVSLTFVFVILSILHKIRWGSVTRVHSTV